MRVGIMEDAEEGGALIDLDLVAVVLEVADADACVGTEAYHIGGIELDFGARVFEGGNAVGGFERGVDGGGDGLTGIAGYGY